MTSYKEITVISYNISVFSAMGFFGQTVKASYDTPPKPVNDSDQGYYPSEARFLRRAEKEKEYFNNAVDHLCNQIADLKPSFIGIQEFYPETFDELQQRINKANPDADYEFVQFEYDIFNSAKTLTVFDKNVFGGMDRRYEADLGYTKQGDDYMFNTTAKPGDKGRPITIIKTAKGFFLMNFHGPNRPRLNGKGEETGIEVSGLLKTALQIHIFNAGIEFGEQIDTTKLIITCDSNDRAHGINIDNPLVLNDQIFHDGHKSREGAKSCCYNRDSCGIDEPSELYESLGVDGAEKKYIYTGDYVLANNFEKEVTPIDSPQDMDGASKASDHRMVYAVVKIPFTGGKKTSKHRHHKKTLKRYRKTTKKTKQSKKGRKSRK